MTDWTLEGLVYGESVREDMPEKVFDLHETEMYAVFSDGETLLLKPAGEIEP